MQNRGELIWETALCLLQLSRLLFGPVRIPGPQ